MSMKVHVLQHAQFEGIGTMSSWLEAQAATVTYTRFFEDGDVPPVAGLDLVIVMGGPMSVNDESSFPWLRREKQFIRDAISGGSAVLGVCLGAQLIASALGARVYPNPCKEIGWFPVEATAGGGGLFRFPEVSTVFHWHGETFDLPPGAVWLARSRRCLNQAFQIGSRVIAMQFHVEMTPRGVLDLLDNCAADLVPGPYVQTASAIRGAAPCTFNEIHALMKQVLEYITGQGGKHPLSSPPETATHDDAKDV